MTCPTKIIYYPSKISRKQSPLELCEQRDPKDLYKLARMGKIKNFTGISSPCEPSENPELFFDTEQTSLKECVDQVLALLYEKKIIQRVSP